MTPREKRRELLMRALGGRFREARTRAGLSQLQVAEACDIGSAMVSMVERGERLPSLDTQLGWSNACGCKLASLYDGLESELEPRRRGKGGG